MLLIASQTYAAGSGAFRLGFGDAESLAKGGAFVGEADNAAAVYHNPAGMIQLEDGQHLSAGFAWLNIFVDHESPSGVETQMRRENIVIPQLYYVNDLNIQDFSFGIGVRSNNGAATEWAEDSFSRYVATRTDLENIDYLAAGAYQLNDNLSVGVGIDVVNAKLSQNKLLNQQPGTDAEAQLKFQDYGVGYTLSTLYKVNEQHQLGLQYRSAIDLKWEGETNLNGLNNLGANPLATIFGGSSYSTDIQWDITLPQNVVIGYSFKPDNKWRFNFDAEWTDWSTIEQLVSANEVVAIGEVGLDYFRGGVFEQQLPVLERFVDLATTKNLPMIFHIRDPAKLPEGDDGSDGSQESAHDDLILFLSRLPSTRRPRGVIHTFSGTWEQAKQYLKLGLHLSFSGVVTYKNAAEIAEGVGAVVLQLQQSFPGANILLLAIFPRGASSDPVRATLASINATGCCEDPQPKGQSRRLAAVR